MLWIPYIIFRNTDSDEAVTVDGDIRNRDVFTIFGEGLGLGPWAFSLLKGPPSMPKHYALSTRW